MTTHPSRGVEKQTNPQTDAIWRPKQLLQHRCEKEDQQEKTIFNNRKQKNVTKNFQAALNVKLKPPSIHSGTPTDRPETTEITKLPSIQMFV